MAASRDYFGVGLPKKCDAVRRLGWTQRWGFRYADTVILCRNSPLVGGNGGVNAYLFRTYSVFEASYSRARAIDAPRIKPTVSCFKAKGGQGGADMLSQLGYPAYMLTLLGACKILGLAALLIPRFPLLKEWAYAGFFLIMTGAIFSHLAIGDALIDVLPSLLLLILNFASWYFRPADNKLFRADAQSGPDTHHVLSA